MSAGPPKTSWDALNPTSYAAGLPLDSLPGVPPPLPSQLEALHAVATDTDASSCSLELTVLFRSAVTDQRTARIALDVFLGINASSSKNIAAGGQLCDVAAWLLGIGGAECAEATAHHLQLLPRQLWCGGARCGGSHIGLPATWAPSQSIASQRRLSEQISSSWTEAPHMAHGRWSWPAADPRCRRVTALSLIDDGVTAAAGADGSVRDGASDGTSDGAVKSYLREAASQWGLSHSTQHGRARGSAWPGRRLELRLGHESLLLRESFTTLPLDRASANASALLSVGYSPPSGTRSPTRGGPSWTAA